ncbi:MAG: YncE family protein, partial [Chlamydiales bacterium]
MALTTTYSNMSLSPVYSNVTAFVPPVQTTMENAPCYRSTSLQEISETARQFIKSLYRIISPENAEYLKPLNEIFNRMISEQNGTIKQALNKPSGYLYRLFSTESWEEWLESKTPLGKVLDVFVNCIRSPKARERLIHRLDADILQKASAQAENLLKQLNHSQQIAHAEPSMLKGLGYWAWSMLPRFSSPSLTSPCAVGLTMGTLGSVVLDNPLLMAAAASSCATVVKAQESIDTEDATSVPTSTPMAFRAYIATEPNNYEGVVSVIDTYNNKLIANVTLGISSPYAIAITPNSRYAYVTSFSTAPNLFVIDTYRNKVVTTVEINRSLHEIAITPNGQYAYIINGVSDGNPKGSISIIELSSKVTTTIAGYGQSPGIAITPNGRFAYVPYWDHDNFFVKVINTSSNEVIKTVTLKYASAIAITPNDQYVYVPSSHSVSVIETSSNTIIATVGVTDLNAATDHVAITPNGLYAYVTTCSYDETSGNVSVI